jgi:hypothetical protein
MLAGEVVRYRRRRLNPHLAQDPTTDRWLRRLGWCALAFLGICLGMVLNEESQGPRWLSRVLLVPLFTAAAGVGVSVCVLGWRNGMRIARSKNWL